MKWTSLRRTCVSAALLTFCILVWNVANVHARQASNTPTESFEWSAELVTVDAAGPTVTVKARVPTDSAFPQFEHLKSGDRVVLTWSGIDKYSDGIRSVAKYDTARKPSERFTFPAEFISFDTERHVATIKIPIPVGDVSKIKTLKPGEWITATSPHGKLADSQPISAIRPYVLSSATSG